MKHYMITLVVLASISITLVNLPYVVYCTEVSVVLWRPTHTSVWCILGKEKNTDSPAVKYYMTAANENTKYLLNELSSCNSIQRCNISMNHYFTLVSLAAWALKNKSTIAEAMRHYRKGSPKEIKALNDQ